MLSIGVMSSSHADYYIGLAKEDYYTGGGEPPGKWFGGARNFLSLDGVVEEVAFRNVFRGYSPDGKNSLTQRQKTLNRAVHRAGWDLTFSAPKSVSVYWSQCSTETRKKIESIHSRSVEEALKYMESTAGKTRRGKGGTHIEDAKLLFAMFEHGTSRAHDPQLHTHALLLNVAVRNDGTTGAVSSRSVFKHKMAAGALYRAELASLLRKELGLESRRVEDWFEIVGVPEELCHEFSKRRLEIEQKLEEKGIQSAKGAASVTLETRTVKETKPRAELYHEWRRVGAQFGWSESQAESLLRHEPPEPSSRLHVDLSELTNRKWFLRERSSPGTCDQSSRSRS